MPISSTSTSVSGAAPSTVSGRPISVLRFCGVATVRRYARSIPRRMSLVDVWPVGPVMPTTLAPSSRRHAVASDCSAASGSAATSTRSASPSACSGATRTPHAPPASACAANVPPSTLAPGSPTNRSPAPTSRESIVARTGRSSDDQSITERLAGDGDVVERDLLPVRELLALLVALAGDQHHVAALGQADRVEDRLATVGDLLAVAGHPGAD